MTPTIVRTPLSEDELADVLREAHESRAAVIPWGSGTRQHIGTAPSRYDIALRTVALDQIVEYTPADLVVTVQAGATLGAVQAALAEHNQCLPWDPPAALGATIGGLLASGAAGPLRLNYGTPRDWTLGMRVALGDGRIVKSGSKVVKNVAGYDSHKLHLGALGTLGVIVEATFKLAPLPVSQRTLLASFPRLEDAIQAVELLRSAPLAPVSLLVFHQQAMQATGLPKLSPTPQGHMLVAARFAGVPVAVERQIDIAVARCAEAEWHLTEILTGERDQKLWQTLAMFAVGGASSVLLRAGARPTALPQLARALKTTAEQYGWSVHLMLYGGVGLAYARLLLPNAANNLNTVLTALRHEIAPLDGYVVVEDAPVPLRDGLDVWGPPPQTLQLMRALKAQWDARDVLNPGRYFI